MSSPPVVTPTDKWGPFVAPSLVLLVICFVAAIVYGPNIHSGFIQDDLGILTIRRTGGVLANNVKLNGQSYVRPVSWTVFGLIFSVWDARPEPYHALSIFILGLTGWCIWGVWQLLVPGAGRKRAMLPALLFVLWPAHGESVCWLGGYPDLFAGLFGAASLWLFLRFGRTANGWLLLCGMLSVFAAIASKESALPLALAIPLLCWVQSSQFESLKSWVSKPATWLVGIMPSLSIGIFWMLRTQLIGKLIGGYATKSPFDGALVHLLGSRGAIEISNLYLPFVREAPRLGDTVATMIITLSAWLALLITAYFWPPSARPSNRWARLLPYQIFGMMALWSVVYLLDSGGLVELARYNLGELYTVGVVISPFGVAYLVNRALPEKRLAVIESYRLGFLLVVLTLGAFLYYHVRSPLDLTWLVVQVLACFFFTRRQTRSEAVSTPYPALFAMTAICAIASISIALNLPVGWDGQQERFSYFGTIFSVMGLAAAVFALPRSFQQWAWVLGISSAWLFTNRANGRWFHVGSIASATASIVKDAPAGSKIFFLAAPGVIDGAGLFQIGIPEMRYALSGDTEVKTGLATYVDTFNAGDRVVVNRLGPSSFSVELKSVPSILHTSRMLPMGDPMFRVDGSKVDLVDRQKVDKVYYIDASGPVLVP